MCIVWGWINETENCKPTCFSHWVTCFCRGSTQAAGLFLLIKGKDAWLTNELWVSQPTRDGVLPAKTARAPGFPISQGSRWFNTHTYMEGTSHLLLLELGDRQESRRRQQVALLYKNKQTWNLLFADLLSIDFLMQPIFWACRLEIYVCSSYTRKKKQKTPSVLNELFLVDIDVHVVVIVQSI